MAELHIGDGAEQPTGPNRVATRTAAVVLIAIGALAHAEGIAEASDVEPAAATYTTADKAVMSYSGAPGNQLDWVGIYVPEAPDNPPVLWRYTGGGQAGSVSFEGLPVGTYEARLFVNDTSVKIATSAQQFVVTASTATVTPARLTFTTADMEVINYTGAPGNPQDWVGIFTPGSADGSPVLWKYTNGALAGSLSFEGLPVGTYEARLFIDNTTTKIATSAQPPFVVTASTATVAPAAPSYTTADMVVINYTGAPGNPHDWVGIYVPGSADGSPVAWKYTNGVPAGSLTFEGLPPGVYCARLFIDDSFNKIATSAQQFAVTAANATVEPAAPTYTTAEKAVINFTGAPGNPHDWIGIYETGAADTSQLLWSYTGGGDSGAVSFEGLAAGTYEARLFIDDSLVKIATSMGQLTITEAVATVEAESPAYTTADKVFVSFTGAPGNPQDWVGIFVPRSADENPVFWAFTGGAEAGAVETEGLAAGSYEARLFIDNSYIKIATSVQEFTVTSSNATVASSAASYLTGDTVVINYAGAPGNAHDWVGIFASGGIAPVLWQYTGGAQAGSLSFQGLPAGTYNAGLFIDDLQVEIAATAQPFSVSVNMPNGSFCETGMNCTSGNCVNSVCCASVCGPCGSCATGTCLALPQGNAGSPSCSPFVCDGVTVVCAATCQSDGDCAGAWKCNATNCVPKKANGTQCAANSECASGSCAQGYCCNSDCSGGCQSCNQNGLLGVCTQLTGVGQCAAGYYCSAVGPCRPQETFGDRCRSSTACLSNTCAHGVCVCAIGVSSCSTLLGGSCASNAECLSNVCAQGACGCALSESYCQATGTCLGSNDCCTSLDCSSPPDSCHVGGGAQCSNGVCVYSVVSCPAGQACLNGACGPAPLTLTVTPTAPPQNGYTLNAGMFGEGTHAILFTATLSNVTARPLIIDGFAMGNIKVVSATVGNVALPQTASLIEVSGIEQNQLDGLMTLAPGAQIQFPIAGLGTYIMPVGQSDADVAYLNYTPAVGSYSVVFAYMYSGGDGLLGPSYRGTITSPPVSFQIH